MIFSKQPRLGLAPFGRPQVQRPSLASAMTALFRVLPERGFSPIISDDGIRLTFTEPHAIFSFEGAREEIDCLNRLAGNYEKYRLWLIGDLLDECVDDEGRLVWRSSQSIRLPDLCASLDVLHVRRVIAILRLCELPLRLSWVERFSSLDGCTELMAAVEMAFSEPGNNLTQVADLLDAAIA